MVVIVVSPTMILGLNPITGIKVAIENFGAIQLFSIVIIGIVFLPFLHESLHIAVHPDLGRSDASIFGMNIMMFYVIYDGPMSRSRMFVYLLTPFFGISILLAALVVIFPTLWPAWTLLIANHVSMCIGDIFLSWKLVRERREFSVVWNCGTALMATNRSLEMKNNAR
jgi:Putative zincin peptidase